MSAVQVRDLTRRFAPRNGNPAVTALDGVSLDVEPGEIRGLLGPNGAGKTTLVKILSTVLLPTGGTASVLGHDVVRDTAAVRRLIGIVFGGERGLYEHMSARQNLEYWAALYQVPVTDTRRRITALLERVGLADHANHLVETFSRGMKQRLHLARGLIGEGRVLFLDEPTTGMDPIAARDFRQLVRELRAEGRTILMTTHDMAEAEAVCDRVALIDHGRLLAVETPRSLSRLIARHERIDFEAPEGLPLEAVGHLPGVVSVTPLAEQTGFRIELADGGAASAVLTYLVHAGVTSIRTSRPSLEEVYVHLVGDRGLKIGHAGPAAV